jgi:hypothetical protein
MNLIQETSLKIAQINNARDKEFINFLKEYNLTPQNLKAKGFEFVIEYADDVDEYADDVEIWKLCKVMETHRVKFNFKTNITHEDT